MASQPAIDEGQRLRLIGHVFLPPKLAQRADECEPDFANTALNALTKAKELLPTGVQSAALDNAVHLISTIRSINEPSSGHADEKQLYQSVTSLTSGRSLAVKVNAQNAAVMITRREEKLIIEAFELSPRNESIIMTKGRLTRTFPGVAVAVDDKVAGQADFASTVAYTLAKMSQQTAPGMRPQSRKAGALHEEERDTTNPALVSDLLFGILKGFGEAVPVSAISKHTRDEILWNNALAPWRRSPTWLLIRVSLQLVITRTPGGSTSIYKTVITFIMGQLLQEAHRLSSDILYVMKAKIGRRLYKLENAGIESGSLCDSMIVNIKSSAQEVAEILETRWKEIQERDVRKLKLPVLATLDFKRDALVSIPKLDHHIAAMTQRQSSSGNGAFTPSSSLLQHQASIFPRLSSGSGSDRFTQAANLQQFEQWMTLHLSSWLDNFAHNGLGKTLGGRMRKYHTLASRHYSDHAEGTSIMLLTLFEMWVACDTIATQTSSLLQEYDPGVPSDVLQNLLLPSLGQMERLRAVEIYLDNRRRSKKPSDLLFDIKSNDSFSSNIEAQAAADRQAKLEEFHRTKAKYERLDRLHTDAQCEYDTQIIDRWCDPPETREVHRPVCRKCLHKRQRDALKICVHEWPLPSSSPECKGVVFELEAPSWFESWRDTRSFFLESVLKGHRAKASLRTSYLLSSNDPHLSSRHSHDQSRPQSRIGLLSETKPVLNSHYGTKKISHLEKSEVWVDNGLRYAYYDTSSGSYVGTFTFSHEVPLACTYKLSEKALQQFMFRTAKSSDGAEPNVVIASQDACPASMTSDEYMELSTMPLGRHIQWSNILLQLQMPGIDFKKPDSTLVILQCIYQAGPPSASSLRESHDMLSSEAYALSLIASLNTALQRVKDNFESAQGVYAFVAIAARILSLSRYNAVEDDCLAFLQSARNVLLGWLDSLNEKTSEAKETSDQSVFSAKRTEVALIVSLTFDVDDVHLADVLGDAKNASSLVLSSILVQDGYHSNPDIGEQHLALLDMRHRRLLHRSYEHLARNRRGLDGAIHKYWPAFTPGLNKWKVVSASTDHWVSTTVDTQGSVAMHVHYNLLNGELLVNGLPLDRPPKGYRDHPLYSTLFSELPVEVMPSPVPGFRFSAKRMFEGHAVHLGMIPSGGPLGGLTVRAMKHDTTFETVPCSLFDGVYPLDFVRGFVHWYDLTRNTVEFRPIGRPWQSSTEGWTLSKDAAEVQWKLTRAGSSVMGIESLSSQRIFRVLGGLTGKSRIHNILQPSRVDLHITLPTLRLSFSLRQGSSLLISKEFRSMAVDTDQSIGTFIGLSNKIVLKATNSEERLALIPESTVSYTPHDGHIVTTSAPDSTSRVHAVHIDSLLGRLIDDGDIGSKLYLAYLHALTSFCLPDPLTGKTGTEQALTILDSAATRSFEKLSQDNVEMLTRIAQLSPTRRYYPANKKLMQNVTWDNSLSFLSQHTRFAVTVESIFQQAQRMHAFSTGTYLLQNPDLSPYEEHLGQRDSIRSSCFRTPGFGAEDHTTEHDSIYTARDCVMRSQNVSTMAGLLLRDSVTLQWPAAQQGSLWQKLQSFQRIHGREMNLDFNSLRYDMSLMSKPIEIVGSKLLALQKQLFMLWPQRKFTLMVWLSTLAFSEDADMNVLQIVAMFCKSGQLAREELPVQDFYYPSEGSDFKQDALRSNISQRRRPFASCPESNILRQPNERLNALNTRKTNTWKAASDDAITKMLADVVSQWPCELPSTLNVSLGLSSYIDIESAMKEVSRLFKAWHHNALLRGYLTGIERSMSALGVQKVKRTHFHPPNPTMNASLPGYCSEEVLFRATAPLLQRPPQPLKVAERQSDSDRSDNTSAMKALLNDLQAVDGLTRFEKEYSEDLEESFEALQARGSNVLSLGPTSTKLQEHLDECQTHVNDLYETIVAALGCKVPATAQSPRLSSSFLLHQLSRTRWHQLKKQWRACIVDFGLALAVLQRAKRLLRLSDLSRREDLMKELKTSGHTNWSPMEYPESLLMEVESGVTIREVQEQIAAEMRQPSSGGNAVVQLNMGEGKSSVIVPIVAAALADGSQLVRVIVAKPQSKQMASMMVAKLGGLVDRRVYYLPFSRSLQLQKADVATVLEILRECTSAGGILLVQPEHILSFQLMPLESYTTGKQSIGKSLLAVQDFLDQNSRDIVDESDENFSVKFELIYTMGTQKEMELSPDRWLLLQRVLEIVRKIAPQIAADYPKSLEIIEGSAGIFPRIRILGADAEVALQDRVARHICDNGIEGFHVSRQPENNREAIYTYITKAELSAEQVQAVEGTAFCTESTQPLILLIRGIIAGGILSFTLQKRWRVDYGLASRTPSTNLAVPFRAKDCPSLRSEFSHPDVVTTLTSLSHYYQGLSDEDMYTTMGHLVDSDQANIEFQAWTQDANNLPPAFQQLQGINLKDRPQCESKLFPALCHSKTVVDYFLSHVVFPKEMKEFPSKLTVSGWDIGKRKNLLTTGFSGTDDSRRLLPIDVGHLDLEEQKHTNALVLGYVLQPENDVQLMAPRKGVSASEDLLNTVLHLHPAVQVILDVGAQILELTNVEVAKTWLELHDHSKEAAIFVNDSDEIRVIDREGRDDLLRTSSYQSRLDSCLVFLDEAHTRGIDLQLPVHYRAAVTLGAGLTKDRLVQACMRMRKLGQGQSLVFCASKEVQHKILETTSRAQSPEIGVADVLLWSITETHADIRRSMPLWAVQGERFVRQEKLWQARRQDGQATTLTTEHAREFLEDEAQTINDRYRPTEIQTQPIHLAYTEDPRLKLISERCQKFEDLRFNSSTLQEEQERELSPEIEQERQVQRAPPSEPEPHKLHKDVETFAETGELVIDSEAFVPAWDAFYNSSASENFSLQAMQGNAKLLVTVDFVRTVKQSARFCSDAFQRPVQWLLSNCTSNHNATIDHLVIISPFESNCLFVRMARSKASALHLYKPRINSGYDPLDQLDFLTISGQHRSPAVPRSLAARLNLFAGQLYLSSYGDYLEVCKALGLSAEVLTKEMSEKGWVIGADGFILEDEQGRVGGQSGLAQNPVSFMKVVIESIRRHGDSIAKTDMGALLEGKLFKDAEFET